MSDIKIYRIPDDFSLPSLLNCVKAGFPSPAQDYLESPIDLTCELVKDISSTFIGRITSSQLEDMELEEDDLVIIDTRIRPVQGDIVVIQLDGEILVRNLVSRNRDHITFSSQKGTRPVDVGTDQDLRFIGVITYVIHKRLRR